MMNQHLSQRSRIATHFLSILISLISFSSISSIALAHSWNKDIPTVDLNQSAKQDSVKVSEDPMYFLGRYSLVVPENGTEMVNTSSIGFGVFTENRRHAYGIRFSWIPNPPANPLASEDEEYIRMNHAFGPLFDWRFFINPNSRMTFYTVTSAGFAFGSPNEESKEMAKKDASLAEATNQVIPILELGVGVVFSKKLGAENEFFLNPEFGLVPGLSAPYMSISAGFNL